MCVRSLALAQHSLRGSVKFMTQALPILHRSEALETDVAAHHVNNQRYLAIFPKLKGSNGLSLLDRIIFLSFEKIIKNKGRKNKRKKFSLCLLLTQTMICRSNS